MMDVEDGTRSEDDFIDGGLDLVKAEKPVRARAGFKSGWG
jgi:hypothetical protein